MPLVLCWRLWLPACNDFDHQMILTRRKGSLGRGHATGGPMKVMDRDPRKRGGKPPRAVDERLNRLSTYSSKRLGSDGILAAFREHGILLGTDRVICDRLD